MTTEEKKRRPKGDGSIQQLGPKKFKVQLDLGRDAEGKRQRKSCIVDSQGKAVKTLNAWKADLLKGTLVVNDNVRLSEYIKRWLEIKEKQTKRSTYESYADIAEKHIIPRLGEHKVQKLTTVHLNDYITAKLGEGLSSATVVRHRAVIHGILDLALKEGIVSRNISENCNQIPIKRKETKTLSKEGINKLLEVARGIFEKDKGKGNRFYQIYHIALLALATGARRGEILALRWENVDTVKNIIVITGNIIEVAGGIHLETPKTEGSRRVMAVDARVLERLMELKEVNPESSWVFCTRDGKPLSPSNMSRAYRDLLTQADLKGIRFHDLRHTHATSLLNEGANIKTVSARLGHTTTRITLDLYAHALPEQDREAANKAGSWLVN